MKDDPVAGDLLTEIRGYLGNPERTGPSASLRAADLLLPVHIRRHSLELRLFSTIMTIGMPQDVTLWELRIETFFPADGASETAWRGLTAG